MLTGRMPATAAAQDAWQQNLSVRDVHDTFHEREAHTMAVTELYITDEIRSRLSEETLAEVAARLHKRDYQTCGKPLGDKAPALSVDDAGPFLSAMLNHQSHRRQRGSAP
ncbi:hypothetical protein [Streptomyces mirabilis]|uniref:hypothetical protein n=1 Tax=Streptomyces mirabilis TaxID=68239 RepID=UPI0036EF8247